MFETGGAVNGELTLNQEGFLHESGEYSIGDAR